MQRVIRFAREFLEAEDGPTAVEYAIMLGMIIVVCIASITALGQNANQTFSSVASSLTSGSGGAQNMGGIGGSP
jgi:pilus assembly protein Flp/PilA